jgi:hypothetical protein
MVQAGKAAKAAKAAKAKAMKAQVKAQAAAKAKANAKNITAQKTIKKGKKKISSKLSTALKTVGGKLVKPFSMLVKAFTSGVGALKSSLGKLLVKTAPKAINKYFTLISTEDKEKIFGGLLLMDLKTKMKNKKGNARNMLAEPYGAGQVQGITLYGCGTGKDTVPGEDYSSFWQRVGDKVPRCWGMGIPLSFGLGVSGAGGQGVGVGGGGTNHEMEHAIKCVTQAMLNFLAQKSEAKSNHMVWGENSKPHILLSHIFQVIGLNAPSECARIVTMIMRKQQVICGLPSCALFNQKKCSKDMIKLTLKKHGTGKEWFYVQISPDKNGINEIARSIVGGGVSTEGICRIDGIKGSRSAFASQALLKAVYKKGGLGKLLSDKEIDDEVQKAFALKNASEEDMIKLLTKQTRIICARYNELQGLNGSDGQDYSGMCIAASLLMMSVSMDNILSTPDKGDLRAVVTSAPMLDDLAAKARDYFSSLEADPGGVIDICGRYEATDDYGDFRSTIDNPATSAYLAFSNSGDTDLNGKSLALDQVGGGIGEYEGYEGNRSTAPSSDPDDEPDEPDDPNDPNEPMKRDTLMTEMIHDTDDVDHGPEETVDVDHGPDDISPEILLFRDVESILSAIYDVREGDDSGQKDLEFILGPPEPDGDSKSFLVDLLLRNRVNTELYRCTSDHDLTSVRESLRIEIAGIRSGGTGEPVLDNLYKTTRAGKGRKGHRSRARQTARSLPKTEKKKATKKAGKDKAKDKTKKAGKNKDKDKDKEKKKTKKDKGTGKKKTKKGKEGKEGKDKSKGKGKGKNKKKATNKGKKSRTWFSYL